MKIQAWGATLAFFFFPFIFLAGCASGSTNLRYHDLFPAAVQSAPIFKGKLVVTSFNDMRPSLQNSSWASGFIFLLPLLYLNEVQSRPEYGDDPENPFAGIQLTNEVPYAIQLDLKRRNIFDGIDFIGNTKDTGDAVWKLEGDLVQTKQLFHYQGYIIPFSALLWLFGLPAGNVTYDVELILRLYNLKNNNIVFEKRVLGSSKTPELYLYSAADKNGRNLLSYYFCQALHGAADSFVHELLQNPPLRLET